MGAELDLTEELRNYIYPINFKTLSSLINENQLDLQKANELILPLILGGLIKKASQPGGTEMIFQLSLDALHKEQNDLRILWSDGGNLLRRSQYFSALLLGDLQTKIHGTINTMYHLKFNSLKILTALASLQVLKYMGNIIRRNQLSSQELSAFLQLNNKNVAEKLPSEFATILEQSKELAVIDKNGQVFWKSIRNNMQKVIAMFF